MKKLAIVRRSKKGGLFLFPSNFGEKIEFIARGCGEFNEGEVVVALEKIYDTLPEDPHRGANFIRVRRLTMREKLELERVGATKKYRVAIGVEDGRVIIEETIYIVLGDKVKSFAADLYKRKRVIGKENLNVRIKKWLTEKGGSSIHLLEKDDPDPDWGIVVKSEKLARKILEEVFGYNVEEEDKKEKERIRAEEEARKKAVAEEAAKKKEEEDYLINLFFSNYPEAKAWFSQPPTWEDIKRETIKRKLARFVRSAKTSHYASFSKEFDCWEYIYEILLGDKKIEFSISTVIYEDGED